VNSHPGAHIAQVRITAGFTQEAFAQHVGISVNTLQCYEQFTKCPSFNTLTKLYAAGFSIDELLRITTGINHD
jgi:DNA-binding transcriptional regulator YiaG